MLTESLSEATCSAGCLLYAACQGLCLSRTCARHWLLLLSIVRFDRRIREHDSSIPPRRDPRPAGGRHGEEEETDKFSSERKSSQLDSH